MRELIILVLILSNSIAFANNSDLNIFLEKKVSVSELFVCALQSRIKCKDNGPDTDICSNSVSFDEQHKVFTININLKETSPFLSGFINSNEEGKVLILKSALEEIALFLGVTAVPDTGGYFKFGEIQKVELPLISGVDSDKLKELIASNTIIELFVKHNGLVYWALRSIDNKKEVVILDQEKLMKLQGKQE